MYDDIRRNTSGVESGFRQLKTDAWVFGAFIFPSYLPLSPFFSLCLLLIVVTQIRSHIADHSPPPAPGKGLRSYGCDRA